MKIKWNTNKFFLKCNSNQEVFLQHISTLQHVLLLLHAERLTDNQFLSTCSPTCLPVIVAKASVILAFQFVISGTGVENTLSLTYPHKKKSRGGWYPAIVVARVTDHLSQSTCLEMLHPKTYEHPNPSVEVHHLVGKLSTAETLLRCNVKFQHVQVVYL